MTRQRSIVRTVFRNRAWPGGLVAAYLNLAERIHKAHRIRVRWYGEAVAELWRDGDPDVDQVCAELPLQGSARLLVEHAEVDEEGRGQDHVADQGREGLPERCGLLLPTVAFSQQALQQLGRPLHLVADLGHFRLETLRLADEHGVLLLVLVEARALHANRRDSASRGSFGIHAAAHFVRAALLV